MEKWNREMNVDTHLLPAGFEALESYVTSWAIDSAAGRGARREASNAEDMRAFYDAASPRLADGLSYLDGKKLAEYDSMDRRLMALLLSLAHVSLAVELQTTSEAQAAPNRRHVRITRATSDL